ncbi:LysE family translocator [Streptomyces sp. NPDC046853]|uniref:LysE family translocator n=1 Tax=Streptomyces sp. NPDC046853 TaxID=3154920 RepID=UPI00340BCD36
MIAWQLFLPAACAMALIPGANQLMGLRNAALGGVRRAVVGLAGRFLAFSLLVALVVMGLGAVLARSALAFELLRWLGVGYLLWLGLSTLWKASSNSTELAHPDNITGAVAFRQEFLTALTNPKALLLFASFLPQFLTPDAPPSRLVPLAAAYVAIEAVAAMLYIGMGRALRREDQQLRVPHRRLDQMAGLGFLGFGGYLAFVYRP